MRTASILAIVTLFSVLGSSCAMLQGDQSAGAYVDDRALVARVKAALLDDEQVKGTRINVNAFNGEVTLSGFANSPEERERAISIARQTPGVKSVQSTINVAQAGDNDEDGRRN